MRVLSLLMVMFVFVIITACNSGGGGQTLSGLEGRWAFTILIEGESNKWEGEWDISSNQVLRDGDALTWTYNGDELKLDDDQFVTIIDPTCGEMHITKLSEIDLQVSPGDYYSNLSGTMDYTEISDSCDPVSDIFYLFGNALRVNEGNVNLADLAGTWDVELEMSGKLDGPLGIKIPIPISDTIETTWIITETGIEDTGDILAFNYNGSTLVVQYAGYTELKDQVCGNGTVFFPGQLSAAIVSGSTSAQINGQIRMTYISDNCGKQSGTITVTGSMEKRT